MSTYWTIDLSGKTFFWLVDDGSDTYKLHAERSGVVSEIKRVRSVRSDIVAHFGRKTIVAKAPCPPGVYNPRIFRSDPRPDAYKMYRREWLTSMRSVRNVLTWMEDVFRVVEPEPRNAKSYGHEIRQLLILACTEVESAWKAILRANGYPTPKNDRWSTNDYIKLLKPLRLAEWCVSLTYHPDFASICPFRTWKAKSPSGSLPWYKAYNAVKHDREALAHEATLKHMVHAAAAAYVLVYAQFGQFGYTYFGGQETDAFYVENVPKWPFSERYLPRSIVGQGQEWTPQNYQF